MMRRMILACGLLWLAAPVAAGGFATDLPALAGAEAVGAESCLDCHDDLAGFFAHTAHAVSRGFAVPGTDLVACEACHGPGSLHMENEGDGGIVGPALLADADPDLRNAMCTQCHARQGDVWRDGPHGASGLTCAVCHGDVVHGGDGAVRSVSEFRLRGEFCLQCHADQAGDFRLPYRHRVLEGEISCEDCHSVHGEREARLGFDGMNEVCFTCHVEMAGPFVYEHDGVSGEDCTVCHRPHGSVNDKLLVQDANGLCLQCHYESDDLQQGDVPHGFSLAQQARCYDCHGEIHGSNVDPNFQER